MDENRICGKKVGKYQSAECKCQKMAIRAIRVMRSEERVVRAERVLVSGE
jgi:hypothetical protein